MPAQAGCLYGQAVKVQEVRWKGGECLLTVALPWMGYGTLPAALPTTLAALASGRHSSPITATSHEAFTFPTPLWVIHPSVSCVW
jgi:hypothetical protein